MRRSSSALALACAVAHGSVAFAQGASKASPEDRAQAQALFDQGVALMEAKNHAAACPKLEASLQRFDGVGTRGKLAQCYEQAGRVASAWAMYREVEALAGKLGDETRASVAREAARALEPRVPHLTVSAGGATTTPGLVIRRNGTEVASGAWGSAVAVDPGKHSVEATAPGYEAWKHEIEIAEGESKSIEVPALRALPVAKQSTLEPGKSEPTSAGPWRPVALVTAGVGVVGLGLGSYFGLRAKSKWDSAFEGGHCDSSNVCDAEGQDRADEARSAAVLSNVFVGAGAVLVAGGAALWFLAPKERPPASAKVRVLPLAEPRRGGLWLEGSF